MGCSNSAVASSTEKRPGQTALLSLRSRSVGRHIVEGSTLPKTSIVSIAGSDPLQRTGPTASTLPAISPIGCQECHRIFSNDLTIQELPTLSVVPMLKLQGEKNNFGSNPPKIGAIEKALTSHRVDNAEKHIRIDSSSLKNQHPIMENATKPKFLVSVGKSGSKSMEKLLPEFKQSSGRSDLNKSVTGAESPAAKVWTANSWSRPGSAGYRFSLTGNLVPLKRSSISKYPGIGDVQPSSIIKKRSGSNNQSPMTGSPVYACHWRSHPLQIRPHTLADFAKVTSKVTEQVHSRPSADKNRIPSRVAVKSGSIRTIISHNNPRNEKGKLIGKKRLDEEQHINSSRLEQSVCYDDVDEYKQHIRKITEQMKPSLENSLSSRGLFNENSRKKKLLVSPQKTYTPKSTFHKASRFSAAEDRDEEKGAKTSPNKFSDYLLKSKKQVMRIETGSSSDSDSPAVEDYRFEDKSPNSASSLSKATIK